MTEQHRQLPGQGLPEAQAEGSKKLVTEIIVTETQIRQEKIGEEVGPVPFITPQDKPVQTRPDPETQVSEPKPEKIFATATELNREIGLRKRADRGLRKKMVEISKGTPGDKGEAGEKGQQGNQGEKGLQGEVGPRGPQGERGNDGLRGESGLPGPRGLDGEKGDPGIPGPQGDPGKEGPAGAQGIQGKPGPLGPAGLDGVRGPQGPQGPEVRGAADLASEIARQKTWKERVKRNGLAAIATILGIAAVIIALNARDEKTTIIEQQVLPENIVVEIGELEINGPQANDNR